MQMVKVPYDTLIDAVAVTMHERFNKDQKRAARLILEIAFGPTETRNLMKDIAVVIDRDDPLVRNWRNEVLKRDKVCQQCGSNKELHAHHISHWADDPVNRINVNNGTTLCIDCHAKEHEDISNLILSKKLYN